MPADPDFQAIAAEIFEMSEIDQEMRKQAVEQNGSWDASIDIANTRRMKEIVQQIGWPTISKVGKQASQRVWLLVQHADHDRDFQKSCLDLMKAQLLGEVRPCDIAYLEDRVRVGEGRSQLYGTQFTIDASGRFGPEPIEDMEHIDERRKAVGLRTLAEYTAHMEEIYHKQSRS
jgi:Family of unknown function (DUF6624)